MKIIVEYFDLTGKKYIEIFDRMRSNAFSCP